MRIRALASSIGSSIGSAIAINYGKLRAPMHLNKYLSSLVRNGGAAFMLSGGGLTSQYASNIFGKKSAIFTYNQYDDTQSLF